MAKKIKQPKPKPNTQIVKRPQQPPNLKSIVKNVISALPKGSLSAGGAALGSILGPAGATAGGFLGNVLSRIIGGGDYISNRDSVVVNSLFDKQPVGAVPQMHINKHVTRISHSEYLGDVLSGSGTPSAFNLGAYNINPGLSNTFPWLSQIAANYESYKFRGCAFCFRSTSGESVASANTALGTVVMAAAYNAGNANFTNKVEMENYEGAISSKPSNNIMFGVECQDTLNALGNHYYIRSGSVPSGQDIKTYDLAKFEIATVGMPAAATNLGELWVTYDVELYEPKLYDSLGQDTAFYHLYNASSVANGTPFGTLSSATTSGNIAMTLSNSAVTFPPQLNVGKFRLLWSYVGSSVTVAAPTLSFTNCSALLLTNNNASNGGNNGGASTSLIDFVDVSITAAGAVVNITPATINVPTSGFVDFFVTELPYSAA